MSGRIHIYNHRLQARLHAGWLFAIDNWFGCQRRTDRMSKPCRPLYTQ